MIIMNYPQLAGWVPAISLPVASFLQLYKIIITKKAAGISALAWILYALANLGAYIFTEKYFAVQSILAFLLTAIFNFAIVFFTLKYNSKQ